MEPGPGQQGGGGQTLAAGGTKTRDEGWRVATRDESGTAAGTGGGRLWSIGWSRGCIRRRAKADGVGVGHTAHCRSSSVAVVGVGVRRRRRVGSVHSSAVYRPRWTFEAWLNRIRSFGSLLSFVR